jgi:hypothetical protein
VGVYVEVVFRKLDLLKVRSCALPGVTTPNTAKAKLQPDSNSLLKRVENFIVKKKGLLENKKGRKSLKKAREEKMG